MAKPKVKPQNYLPIGASYNFPLPPEKKESEYLTADATWVYSAVTKISRQVAMIDLKLYKKKYVGGELEIEQVTEHEALSLLYEVNDFFTKQMFLEVTQTYLDLTGEAAWAILRSNGTPVELWPLRPDWISIVPSKNEYIDSYLYRPGGVLSGYMSAGMGVPIKKEDLIFFKYPNPVNPYRGMGAVQAGAMAIDIDTYSDKWNRTFFFNAALPSLIFTTDQKINKEQITRFMEMWRNKFEGADNSHKVAFLGGGMKPTPLGGNMRDLDFLEGKKYLRDEILAMFHVSKANIGVVEDVNRATQEATDSRFMKDVIKPRMTALISYLNEFYLPNWPDEGLFFDFVDPTPEDRDMELKVYKNALGGDGNAPWMTINEVRELENLEPVEGGDTILLSMAFQPIGTKPPEPSELGNKPEEAEEETEEEEEKGFLGLFKGKKKARKQPLTLKVPKKTEQQRIRDSLTLPIPPKRLREIRVDMVKKQIKSDLVKMIMNLMSLKEKKPNGREEYWKAMILRTDIQEQKMMEKITYLWDEQESVVKHNILSKGKNIDGMKYKTIRLRKLNDFLFDEEAENEKWISIFKPFVKTLVEDSAREVFDFLGLAMQLNTTTSSAIRFLQKEGLEFITSVNSTTKQKLRDVLSEGLIKGEGIDDLQLRVQEVFEAADSTRAKMIARTEVLRSTNFASEEAYKQSGVVKGKEWLASLDERVCDNCKKIDGQVVNVGEKFSLGVQYPPVHPNCRCTTIPVLNERLVNFYWQKAKEVKEVEEENVLNIKDLQEEEKKIRSEVKSKVSKIRTNIREKLYEKN